MYHLYSKSLARTFEIQAKPTLLVAFGPAYNFAKPEPPQAKAGTSL